jgi:hypothetical protein
MTGNHTSRTSPNVQVRSLRRRAVTPRFTRLTLRVLWELQPGESCCDLALPGLRYRRVLSGGTSGKSTLRAQFRYTHPFTGKRASIELGRLLSSPAELLNHRSCRGHPVRSLTGGHQVLEEVRAKARLHRAKLVSKEDPRTELGAGGYTLAQAKNLHLENIRRKGRSEATIAEYELAACHLSDLLNTPLQRLSSRSGRELIRAYHSKIAEETGPVAANKTMRGLRAFWNTARRADPTLGESPTIAVHWFKEWRRQSAIPLVSLPIWFAEVAAMGNHIKRDLFLLTVLTGLRKATVRGIWCEQVDLKTGTLSVPRPKGGVQRAFVLPLSDAAVMIVQRRLAASSSGWLFPSVTSKSGHIEDPRPELVADGLSVPFTLHGLRATYIGAGHAAGLSDRHVQLLANHAVHQSDVHGGYILPDPDALRPSQQRVTDYFRSHGLPL